MFPKKFRHLLGLADAELRAALGELSTEDIAELRTALRAFVTDVAALDEVSADVLAEAKSARTIFATVREVETERAEIDEAATNELEEIVNDVLSDDDGGETADEEDDAEADDEVEQAAENDDEANTEAADEANTTLAYRGTARRRVAAADIGGDAADDAGPQVPAVAFTASAGLNGHRAGDVFEGRNDLAKALVSRYQDIAGGGTERITVATVKANFDEAHTLNGTNEERLAKLGGPDLRSQPAALVAAICAPAEPYYGLGCMSSVARPVRGSLGQFAAARGAVTVYPSPRLADVVSGRGVWSRADDLAGTGIKNCASIPCSSPVQYDIYGIWRCLTVTNMMQMTYPELVDAFLNRLEALQASLAESTLLNAMVGSVNTRNLTADLAGWGYSANQSLLDTFIETLSAYKEGERYDDGQRFDAWSPRWVRAALAIDLINRKNLSGNSANQAAALAEVSAGLSSVGIDMTWTLDYATNWTKAPVLPADSGAVPALPTTANVMLAPKGNFRVLDRGELAIGVTNNHIYRDNDSNAHNRFTMFYESFEGLIDFGCTSVELTISNLKPTGAQVADATISTR